MSARHPIATYYRVLLRGQLTPGRMAVLSVLSAIAVVVGALSRRATGTDGSEGAALFALGGYGLGALVPIAALTLAVPMLANLVEDRLLVYLWLKPVPRWYLSVAAFAAVVTVLVPVVVVPLIASALVAGKAGLVGPIALAGLLGSLAYAGLYLFFGVRFSAGLWIGLVYLVVWENVFAGWGNGPARLSVRSYLLTVLEWGTDRRIPLADRAPIAAVIVPLVTAAVGVALSAWTLARREID